MRPHWAFSAFGTMERSRAFITHYWWAHMFNDWYSPFYIESCGD